MYLNFDLTPGRTEATFFIVTNNKFIDANNTAVHQLQQYNLMSSTCFLDLNIDTVWYSASPLLSSDSWPCALPLPRYGTGDQGGNQAVFGSQSATIFLPDFFSKVSLSLPSQLLAICDGH